MKLARPDIRHPRIVLAGRVAEHGGDDGLVAALRSRGLHARWMSWDDPDTLRADLVILRAGTEYQDRLDEFLAWATRVPNLLNAPDVVAWNAGKHYRRDLERAGIPMLAAAPADTTALVFLGGMQSHAFSSESPVEADFEIWDLGYSTLAAAAQHLGISASELLYARVDVAGKPGEARLVGLDLVAPTLGWQVLGDAARADAQRQFALCVESALERLGLGPFSHRRP
jgi:hypothetical protein